MDKEEIDEVVRELDVFITDAALDAFLLQFPLKPEFAGTTLPPEIPVARFKKQFKKLEVEIPFASSSTQRNKPPIKQIFHSATVARSTCLAAGIIHNGAMHITAFQDVLQMRPTFKSKQQPGNSYTDPNLNVMSSERTDNNLLLITTLLPSHLCP